MRSKLQLTLHNNSNPEQELDIMNAILLENQSTLDLIFNNGFKRKVNKYKTNLKVQENVVTLIINHRSKIPWYNQTTWFSKKTVTNILSF